MSPEQIQEFISAVQMWADAFDASLHQQVVGEIEAQHQHQDHALEAAVGELVGGAVDWSAA